MITIMRTGIATITVTGTTMIITITRTPRGSTGWAEDDEETG